MRHVILGNSAAGTRAAEVLRRVRPGDDVTMVCEEGLPAYSRCLLTYYVGGLISKTRLLWRTPGWYRARDIHLVPGSAVSVESGERLICRLADGVIVPYDRLLIATGASPIFPRTMTCAGGGVLGLRTLRDADSLRGRLVVGGTVVVVGGGFVGLKLTNSLVRAGARVVLVTHGPRVLGRMTDAEASGRLVRLLEGGGVLVKLHTDAEAIEPLAGAGRVAQVGHREPGSFRVSLSDGSVIAANAVVVAAGVGANSECMSETECRLDRKAIEVDASQATSLPLVYAAGDVCSMNGETFGIWPVATEQAATAAMNMAGFSVWSERFVPMNTIEVFERWFASIGRPPKASATMSQLLYKTGSVYQKLVLDDGVPVQFLAVGDISGAGVIAAAIRYGQTLNRLRSRPAAQGIPVLDHGTEA